jgi:hypothetical protein
MKKRDLNLHPCIIVLLKFAKEILKLTCTNDYSSISKTWKKRGKNLNLHRCTIIQEIKILRGRFRNLQKIVSETFKLLRHGIYQSFVPPPKKIGRVHLKKGGNMYVMWHSSKDSVDGPQCVRGFNDQFACFYFACVCFFLSIWYCLLFLYD